MLLRSYIAARVVKAIQADEEAQVENLFRLGPAELVPLGIMKLTTGGRGGQMKKMMKMFGGKMPDLSGLGIR